MEFLIQALSAIPTAAASPYALSAYAMTIAAYVAVAFRVTRNKQLLANLEKLPARDRGRILESEMRGYRLASGISPEQYLRAQTHRYLLVAFLVTIVLAAAITMLAIWRGTAVSQSATNNRRSEPEITLRSVSPVESEFLGNLPPWELRVKVAAEFYDARLNTSVYLAALDNLAVTGLIFGSKRDSNWELASYAPRGSGAGTRAMSDRGQTVSEAELYSYVAASGDPLAGATLQFLVGPLRMSKALGNVNWRLIQAPGRDASRIAVVEALIRLPAPTWAFIRQARLLPTETPRQSILNVFVENMSEREVSVSALSLSAVQDMPSVSCAVGGSVPITTIHLDWKRIVSIGDKNASAPVGWTKLNESRVPITGRFQEQPNPCSGAPPSLTTLVPMDYVIPASKVLSIDFQIDESIGARHSGDSPASPASKRDPASSTEKPDRTSPMAALFGRPAPLPSDLSSWDHVFVGFGEHDEVYPHRIQVDFPSK